MGFLRADLPADSFVCKKCGAELISYPDVDEDTIEVSEYQGKICVIGKPKPKIVRLEDLWIKRQCKRGAKAWKAFL